MPLSRERERPLRLLTRMAAARPGCGANQHSGTAGRIESAQVGAFIAYASRRRRALIDRRLSLTEN
jgi:hypothetical protein